MKRYRYLAIAGLASLGLLASAGTQALAAGPTYFTSQPNPNYAGWSVHPPSGVVTKVGGDWTVPEVQCNARFDSRAWNQSRTAMWVGIWGQNPSSKKSWLAQVGTVSQCLDGLNTAPTTFAEMFPNDPKPLSLQVHPGDTIAAFVNYRGRVAEGKDKGSLKFSYTLTDIKADRSGTTSVGGDLYTDKGVQVKDAVWQGGSVVEQEPNRTLPGAQIGGLAKFTTPVAFDPDTAVNDKLINQYSGYSTVNRWDMYNTTYNKQGKPELGNKQLAITGPEDTTGNGFQVTWKNWN